MNPEVYAAIGIFILTQVGIAVATVTAQKGDTKALNSKVSDMRDELKKLAEVVIAQALQGQRITNLEDRQMAQGKRLDASEQRVNRYFDKIAFDKMDGTGR